MEYTYELWEIAIGKHLARYGRQNEMATLIRTLVNRHGAVMVESLELYVEDETGETVKTYAGAETTAWADGVLGDIGGQTNTDRPRVAGARLGDSGDGGRGE